MYLNIAINMTHIHNMYSKAHEQLGRLKWCVCRVAVQAPKVGGIQMLAGLVLSSQTQSKVELMNDRSKHSYVFLY